MATQNTDSNTSRDLLPSSSERLPLDNTILRRCPTTSETHRRNTNILIHVITFRHSNNVVHALSVEFEGAKLAFPPSFENVLPEPLVNIVNRHACQH